MDARGVVTIKVVLEIDQGFGWKASAVMMDEVTRNDATYLLPTLGFDSRQRP